MATGASRPKGAAVGEECVSDELSMASAEEVKPSHGEQVLTLENLKRQTGVTDEQLDMEMSEPDLPSLASCFDTTVGYVEALGLSAGEQTDVQEKKQVHGTKGGMILALKCWMRRNIGATFIALILIVLALRGGEVAVELCHYVRRKRAGPVSQLRVHPGLASYRLYLQSRYTTDPPGPRSSTEWPPVQISKVFKLAMIKKENVQKGKIDENFVRRTITGKIDDILLESKAPVELENIFTDIKEERKFVLFEGAPGSGKSTLALHISQEWGRQNLFQEYDLVILVKLRDPQLPNARSISDLLPCADDEMANKAEAAMKSVLGSGILWVLDGWDELPQDLPQDSIINTIVFPSSSRKCPLPKCSVIITSRPSSSAGLHQHVSLRVEVLGFTPEEQEQFFTECLGNNPQVVSDLLERIRQNPVVEGSCYLPLNASIVVHVFISGDQSLPSSNTGIFISLVKCILKRYLQDKVKTDCPVGDITEKASLAAEIKTPFGHLCEIAFHGSMNNKVTFTDVDLGALSIPTVICDVGLLQSVPSIIADGRMVYFSFLHLSIQELLTAIHISHMSPKQQISIFNDLFENPRFNAVFQFYAGITKLRAERPILSKLPRALCPVPATIMDLVRKIGGNIYNRDFISLLHCIYESEDPEMAKFVANLRSRLNLRSITLTPLDCLALGYFLSLVCTTRVKPLSVIIYHSIGDQGCKLLSRGLLKNLTRGPHSNVTAPLKLDIERNDITDHGVSYLSEVIANTSLLQYLDLGNNKIGEVGFQSICEVLSTNTSLEELRLDGCSLPTHPNTPALREFLSKNSTLKTLYLNNNDIREGCVFLQLSGLEKLDLSSNPISDCGQFSEALARHSNLKVLGLFDCGLTDARVEELCPGLNNHLEELDIRSNNNITQYGLKKLLKQLNTLTKFRVFRIPNHLEGCKWDCWSEVRENRKPPIFRMTTDW